MPAQRFIEESQVAGQIDLVISFLDALKYGSVFFFRFSQRFLGFFEFGDIRCHLQAHKTIIDPLNCPIIINVPLFGYRVFVLPDINAGGFALVVQQFLIGAIMAGFGFIAEGAPAGLTDPVMAKSVAHMLVHKKNLIRLDIRHINVGINAVQNRKKLLMGVSQGVLDAHPFHDFRLVGFEGIS